MTNKRFRLGKLIMMLIIVLAFGMTVVDCGSNESNDGTGTGTDTGTGTGTGGGTASIGCSSLKAGTKCTAHSVCGDKFHCMTGQGSDSNCTSSCSCDG
jgi:hypothetical protein